MEELHVNEEEMYEAQIRGVLNLVEVKDGERVYRLNFYTKERFLQDFEIMTNLPGEYFIPSGYVVINGDMNIDNVRAAIKNIKSKNELRGYKVSCLLGRDYGDGA